MNFPKNVIFCHQSISTIIGNQSNPHQNYNCHLDRFDIIATVALVPSPDIFSWKQVVHIFTCKCLLAVEDNTLMKRSLEGALHIYKHTPHQEPCKQRLWMALFFKQEKEDVQSPFFNLKSCKQMKKSSLFAHPCHQQGCINADTEATGTGH